MYRRKYKPLLPGSWTQKKVFLKFHLLGKRRGLIKYHRKIERNTLYLLVKKEIFLDLCLREKNTSLTTFGMP
jgi:hypothetical protein